MTGRGSGLQNGRGGWASEVLPLQQAGCRQRFRHAEEGVGKKGFEVVLTHTDQGGGAHKVSTL